MSFWKRLSSVLGFNWMDWTNDVHLFLKRPPFRSFAFGVKFYFGAAVFNFNGPDPVALRLRTSIELFWLPTSWCVNFKEGGLLWRKHRTLYKRGRWIWLEDLRREALAWPEYIEVDEITKTV